MGNSITARYQGTCKGCGGTIRKGESITNHQRVWIHTGCADSEYAAGRADGDRYTAEKKIFGAGMAEMWRAQDEWNRYWVNGEDY
jgi:hypothetical protein